LLSSFTQLSIAVETISDPPPKEHAMPHSQPEDFVAYIAFTAGFLFLIWLVNKRTRPLGTNLILWGISVVILSCGYGLIGVPPMIVLTAALMKIGFLLVLGGVAWSLLAACPSQSASKEADHV
jgi:hypothetical protein